MHRAWCSAWSSLPRASSDHARTATSTWPGVASSSNRVASNRASKTACILFSVPRALNEEFALRMIYLFHLAPSLSRRMRERARSTWTPCSAFSARAPARCAQAAPAPGPSVLARPRLGHVAPAPPPSHAAQPACSPAREAHATAHPDMSCRSSALYRHHLSHQLFLIRQPGRPRVVHAQPLPSSRAPHRRVPLC